MKNKTNIFVQKKIIDQALMDFKQNIDMNVNCYPEKISKLLKYFHKHLFDNTCTIQKAKRLCMLSNNNIVTEFRCQIKLGPKEYIRNLRLKAATTLLKYEELNVYLIAEAVGYSEEAFSKLFKKTYHTPPLQFQQMILREMDKKNQQEKKSRGMSKSL